MPRTATAAAAVAATMKFYAVEAGARNSKDGESTHYVIGAESYKIAWELGREVTRTGSADFVEKYADNPLVSLRTSKDDDTVPSIKAGILSVRNVESLEQRSSKVEPLTVDRMLEVCAERSVKIPANLQSLIDELRAAGPAPSAEPQPQEGEQQQAAG